MIIWKIWDLGNLRNWAEHGRSANKVSTPIPRILAFRKHVSRRLLTWFLDARMRGIGVETTLAKLSQGAWGMGGLLTWFLHQFHVFWHLETMLAGPGPAYTGPGPASAGPGHMQAQGLQIQTQGLHIQALGLYMQALGLLTWFLHQFHVLWHLETMLAGLLTWFLDAYVGYV